MHAVPKHDVEVMMSLVAKARRVLTQIANEIRRGKRLRRPGESGVVMILRDLTAEYRRKCGR